MLTESVWFVFLTLIEIDYKYIVIDFIRFVKWFLEIYHYL